MEWLMPLRIIQRNNLEENTLGVFKRVAPLHTLVELAPRLKQILASRLNECCCIWSKPRCNVKHLLACADSHDIYVVHFRLRQYSLAFPVQPPTPSLPLWVTGDGRITASVRSDEVIGGISLFHYEIASRVWEETVLSRPLPSEELRLCSCRGRTLFWLLSSLSKSKKKRVLRNRT